MNHYSEGVQENQVMLAKIVEAYRIINDETVLNFEKIENSLGHNTWTTSWLGVFCSSQ